MRAVMRIIDRGLVILGAYLFASIVAALALAVSLANNPDVSLVILALMYGSVLVAMYAAIPTALVVAFAESVRMRSPYFYATTGILVGIIAAVVFFLPTNGAVGMRAPTASLPVPVAETIGSLVAFSVSGLIAGLIYWRMAGRYAGAWRDQQVG